jgi:LysM repeat protein
VPLRHHRPSWLAAASGLATTLIAALTFASPVEAWAGPCRSGETKAEDEVKPGDTLSHIGRRHGVGYKVVERSNPGIDPARIRVGQRVNVCVPDEQAPSGSGSSKSGGSGTTKLRSCGGSRVLSEHKVEKGDTISRIARRYESSEKSLYSRNPSLKNDPQQLRIGQTLKVCGGNPNGAKKSRLCGYETPLHKHEVLPGDNAAGIAGQYGVRRKDLYRINPKLKANPNLVRVGSTVLVCPVIAPRQRTRTIYTVKKGDTLGAIARRYKVSRGELLSYQRGALGDDPMLHPGDELVVYEIGGTVPGFGALDSDTGTLDGGAILRSGPHYTAKAASLSWGTQETINAIQRAIAAYARVSNGGPKVHVGDISRQGGGKFPPHSSHQHGRDVDVGYVLEGSLANKTVFKRATKDTLDAKRTYRLIKAFIDSGKVRYVFVDWSVQKLLYDYAKSKGVSRDTLNELFQYPRPRGRSYGIIRHWKGHDDHFHVRFRK